MAYRIFVDGQEGTTGLQIVQRLSRHPEVTLLSIDPDKRKDPEEKAKVINASDVTFLCLPDAAAKESAALLNNAHTRMIDASTAHRVDPGWAYGIPELSPAQRDRIAGAQRVANPGCHASGFVMAVAPLVAAGLLPPDALLSCHSITGYSGGGKKMIAEYEDAGRNPVLSGALPYGLTLRHKHIPEMAAHTGLTHPPIFLPILGDFAQGMLVHVPLHNRQLTRSISGQGLRDLLAAHYEGEAFVEVLPLGAPDALYAGRLDPQALNGTNRLEILVFSNGEQHVLVSRLDNLGKGASGAAVQNMNVMLGLDERLGLTE